MSNKQQMQGADLMLLSQRAKKKTESQAKSARHFLAAKRDILKTSFFSLKKNLKLGCIFLTLRSNLMQHSQTRI
jgi:hypothetical protein